MNVGWKRVFATHLEPQQLSVGEWRGEYFPGVALPSKLALNRWVILRYGDRFTCAQVVDVGPWCIDDDAYVFGTAKPRAEQHRGSRCLRSISDPETIATVPDGNGGFKEANVCNGAGIDLFPYTAKQLGIPLNTNVEIEWRLFEL